MTSEQVAKIIRSLCYYVVQGKEGRTLPTEDIEFIYIGGIEMAADAIVAAYIKSAADGERVEKKSSYAGYAGPQWFETES